MGICKYFINKAQKRELETIAEKFEDISVDNISSLVRYNEGKYIVWLDNNNEYDWETTSDYDELSVDRTKRNSYMSRISFLEHHPMVKCLSKYNRKEFHYMLADAVVLVLEGEFNEADEKIFELNRYLNDRNCEITRKWQLLYCFATLLVIFIIFVIGRHNMQNIIEFLKVDKRTIDTIGFSMLGTIGATLSIVLKSGNQCYDCESGKLLNFLEIFSRMFTSIISSFVAVCLYKMGMIFANFNSGQNATYCLILVCIIAGFSERLIPSIISRFENSETKEECCNDKESINNI